MMTEGSWKHIWYSYKSFATNRRVIMGEKIRACFFSCFQESPNIYSKNAYHDIWENNVLPYANKKMKHTYYNNNLLLTPRRLLQRSALFDYPLLRLQQVVTPLGSWPHPLFSACRSPDGRFHVQRPLCFHVTRKHTYYECFIFMCDKLRRTP